MATSGGERPWYLDAVIYQVYLRGFQDSNGDGIGDLPGLISRLDHVVELGADTIWLMPHYPSPRFDDGYDVADYRAVAEEYGTLDDFRALVAACHERGLRLLLDLVLNHVSCEHPWFRSARAGSESPWRDWFVWSDTGTEYPEARIIFHEAKGSNWTFDELAGRFYWHRFYKQQPDLNYDHPDVPEAMLDVARFWLELGVDGFRVDAIPYLYERDGTDGENLPETHRFCQRLRALVDESFPHAVLLCEACQPIDRLLPYLGSEGIPEFHLGFHFPLMTELFVALAEGRATPVVEELRRMPPLPPGTALLTFLRNHDELTLERGSAAVRALLKSVYLPPGHHTANGGIPRRLWPLLGGDRRKVELLHALLLGLDQPPCFYYGDELGMGEDPSRPDRHPVRTPMQWSAAPHGGFTAGEPFTPVIDDPLYGYGRINADAARADPGSFFHRLRRLIAVRRATPALAHGSLALLGAPPELLAWRRRAGNDEVVAVYNFAGAEVGTGSLRPASVELLAGSGEDAVVEPFGWRWWRVTGTRPR